MNNIDSTQHTFLKLMKLFDLPMEAQSVCGMIYERSKMILHAWDMISHDLGSLWNGFPRLGDDLECFPTYRKLSNSHKTALFNGYKFEKLLLTANKKTAGKSKKSTAKGP